MEARDRYSVEFIATDQIKPSPENDDIYGTTNSDEHIDALIASIDKRGLEEPLIVTSDDYIMSGHRRYFACTELGLDKIPVRRKEIERLKNLNEWPRILAEFNTQRVKSLGSMLREALLAQADANPTELLQRHYASSTDKLTAEYQDVDGVKGVRPVSESKQQFLKRTQEVVESLADFWPLTARQIHYQLLNNPPLISTPKRTKHDIEKKYRYRNNESSYNALLELLKSARYSGEIRMDVIDDPTRPAFNNAGWADLGSFVQDSMDGFLNGYRRDRQTDQPKHIEVLGEKNTLLQILKPVCWEYCIPMSLSRGYGTIPLWRDIAGRFRRTRKKSMTLIVASDFDPEGIDLAKDAVRSLRDQWDITVGYHRVGVNRDQIDELNLASDFNPAKRTSSRYKTFVDETGTEKTWELEALPPRYIQKRLREAIEENMDMDAYQQSVDRETEEARELMEIRDNLTSDLEL